MSRIYYNAFYDGKPYVGKSVSFGLEYCGDNQLLRVLMLHGGIVPPLVSEAQREVEYCNHLRENIKPGIFFQSFMLDPLAVSKKILKWRDALVESGWTLGSGTTDKLRFIREMEPPALSKGTADCWREVLRESKSRSLLPENSEIIVTQDKESVAPRIRLLLDNLRTNGVAVSYMKEDGRELNDLGRLTKWIDSDDKSHVRLENDGSIKILKFADDSDAMKYMACCKSGEWDLWLCQQPKQFDNILRSVGRPVCGSELSACEPQVVKLFSLGNGLFERPLNLNRILAWLEAPISPLKRSLGHSLGEALASSGGIENEEWNAVIDRYLDETDERKRRAEEKRLKTFLPLLASSDASDGKVTCEEVVAFNKALRQWATGLLEMADFPYEMIVRDQLGKIAQYCESLIMILENYPMEEIPFLSLENYCRSISGPGTYIQYEAALGCPNVIHKEGNIHTEASSMAWFCISAEDVTEYPYDFLTDEEFSLLASEGVALYDRTHHARARNDAMLQTLRRVRSLTLVEAEKIGDRKVRRHPLMIQLESALGEGMERMTLRPELPEEYLVEKEVVRNDSSSPVMQIASGVTVPRRDRPESFSSIETLIQHPFDYVCRYLAKLNDKVQLTIDDVDRTLGNVAHKMIEMVFNTEGRARYLLEEDEYEKLFQNAVDRVGLLLRQPENILELKELYYGMKHVLKALNEFVVSNSLTVIGSEKEFEIQEWSDGATLGSRADLLLEEENGTKVVLDFKWTANRKKYVESVETDTDLQLAIYRWLAEKQYGDNVKAAYVVLPSMTIITSDSFKGVEAVERKPDIPGRGALETAAAGYDFRLSQIAAGRIERAEGLPLEDSEYGRHQSEGLFPLKTDKDGYICASYNSYKNLR